jgi:hypothetical protein
VSDGAGAGESVDPAGAFGVVASDTRLDILRALWDAGDPQPFSAVREAVGVADSGRFNYHLGKLVGRFVRETAGGYELTYAGEWVVGSVRSGVYTESVDRGPLDAGDCPRCAGQLRATYRDGIVEGVCKDCTETIRGSAPRPPCSKGSTTRNSQGRSAAGW